MGKEYKMLFCSLRRQHHLLWLLLGVGFSLFLCAQLVQEGPIGIGLMIALLASYYFMGQLAARLVARSALRSAATKTFAALLRSSFKIGVLFAIVSVLFHLVRLCHQRGPHTPWGTAWLLPSIPLSFAS